MLIKKTLKNYFGFTLVEIMISVFIFSLLSTVVGGIYVAFSASQNRAQAAQKLLNETQFVLDSIAKEIANAEIYYPYMTDCVDDDSCVILKRNDGKIIYFSKILSQISEDWEVVYIVRDPETGHEEEINILPLQGTIMNDFNIIVNPSTDPFVEGGPNQMPLVTIEAQITVDSSKDIEQVSYNLQTSVSSRIFPD
jgi:prepilin-type N-terminal cleavage/methylation domain-containing protein